MDSIFSVDLTALNLSDDQLTDIEMEIKSAVVSALLKLGTVAISANPIGKGAVIAGLDRPGFNAGG